MMKPLALLASFVLTASVASAAAVITAAEYDVQIAAVNLELKGLQADHDSKAKTLNGMVVANMTFPTKPATFGKVDLPTQKPATPEMKALGAQVSALQAKIDADKAKLAKLQADKAALTPPDFDALYTPKIQALLAKVAASTLPAADKTSLTTVINLSGASFKKGAPSYPANADAAEKRYQALLAAVNPRLDAAAALAAILPNLRTTVGSVQGKLAALPAGAQPQFKPKLEAILTGAKCSTGVAAASMTCADLTKATADAATTKLNELGQQIDFMAATLKRPIFGAPPKKP